MDTCQFVIELLKVIAWPVTTVIIAIKVKSILKNGIKSFSFKAGDLGLSFENFERISEKAIPQAGEMVFNKEDVKEILTRKITYLKPDEIEKHIDYLYTTLLKYGISTKRQLNEAYNDKNITTIEVLYKTCLPNRKDEAPLDPIGAVSYIPPLYIYGNNASTMNRIKNTLLLSVENKNKYSSSFSTVKSSI